MFTIHMLLLAAAAVLVAAVSAGNANLRRRGEDLPLMGYIIGGALVVGNAACLLPSAPDWYGVTMIAVSLAGVAWFLVSAASSTETESARGADARLIAQDIYAGRVPVRPVPARPVLRVVRTTPAEKPATEPQAPVVATQETFHAASPQGSRATTGATYVAADIDNYLDARGTRTAHGRHAARTHTKMDPTERFLRLADAYSIDRGPRSLGRSALS